MAKIKLEDIEVRDRKRELNQEKVDELVESIKEIGLIQPIAVVWVQGTRYRLVAGMHRLEAAKQLGWIEIPSALLRGMDAINEELAEIDENVIRHLHYLDRADLLARKKELLEEKQKYLTKGGDRKSEEYKSKRNDFGLKSFSEDTANRIKTSSRTVEQEVQISKNLIPEVKEKIRSPEINLPKTEALKLARVEPEQQKEIIEKIEGGAKNVASAQRQIRQEEVKESPPELPEGIYSVILIDPPWQYDFSLTDNRKIENQYPTMDIQEICDLEVPTADDCVLFLWTTTAKLQDSFDVIESWGFTYKTSMVWVKDKIGMGYYVRNKHEFVLICTKGKPQIPEPSDRPPSVFQGSRTKHSSKPECLYELIEKMYPEQSYLEMFARSERDGWTSWGNEV